MNIKEILLTATIATLLQMVVLLIKLSSEGIPMQILLDAMTQNPGRTLELLAMSFVPVALSVMAVGMIL